MIRNPFFWAALMKSVVLLAMVLVQGFLVSGCRSETGLYKTFITEEGAVKFSFEYPASFNEPVINKPFESVSTTLATQGIIELGENWSGLLVISIIQHKDNIANAIISMENELAEIEQDQSIYHLLDRSDISIAGNDGKYVVFSIPGSYQGEVVEAATVYKAYFSYQDLIWTIEMIVNEYPASNEVLTVFKHILKTLEILD